MRGNHLLPDPISGVQHDSNPPVHCVRRQDQEDPLQFQRGQVHRVHHVLYLHRLASIHTDIFWNQP